MEDVLFEIVEECTTCRGIDKVEIELRCKEVLGTKNVHVIVREDILQTDSDDFSLVCIAWIDNEGTHSWSVLY